MKKIFLFAAAMLAGLAVQAEPVVSGELFATFQKHGDTFYKGSGETNLEAEHFDWNINYYIVLCGDSMWLRATTTEDRTFNAGWQTQLRVWNASGTYDTQRSEVQTNEGGGTKNCFTSVGKDFVAKNADALKFHFFVDWEGNCTTQPYDFNRASVNNPIDDNVAPVIDPTKVTMEDVNGVLVFTFGEVTADDEYFFYVGDKDHNVGSVSLNNKVYITKPTVEDGTTYVFKCGAVDFNGNISETKEFTLEMPFDPAVDLALNKACKAGAVQNDNTADRAVNGNPDNFWTCFGQGEETDWWWSVDLGNAYKINQVTIHFNDAWEAYSLLYSWDNETWKTVLENETAESNSTKDYNTLDFSARYLKVTSVGSHLGIREFNVFATGLAEQDQQTPTSVVATDEHLNVQKLIRNAELLILRDGEIYTVQGTLVR